MTVFAFALGRLFNSQNPDGSQHENGDNGAVNLIRLGVRSSAVGLPSSEAVGFSNMTTPPQRVVSCVDHNRVSVARKRLRDPSFGQMSNYGGMESSSFVVDTITPLIQQQQIEIDSLIDDNNKRLRTEITGRQAQQARKLVTAVCEESFEKLKFKEDETRRMGRDIAILQQKVTSLIEDNRLLKESNMVYEATINSLQEKLLKAIESEQLMLVANATMESHCDSNIIVDVDTNVVASNGGYGMDQDSSGRGDGGGRINQVGYNDGDGDDHGCFLEEIVKCKICGEREATFVMLPCNHLCFCSVCVAHLPYLCPVCDEFMNSNVVPANLS